MAIEDSVSVGDRMIHWGTRTALALLSIGAVGCMARARVPVLAVQLHSQHDPAMYERMITTAQSQGYAIVDSNPDSGRFRLRARYGSAQRSFGMPSAAFVVQLFQEGWAVVLPSAPLIERMEGGLEMPAPLAREYVQLVQVLQTSSDQITDADDRSED
jgi:hypothetical protein